jgi:hypothetical protein
MRRTRAGSCHSLRCSDVGSWVCCARSVRRHGNLSVGRRCRLIATRRWHPMRARRGELRLPRPRSCPELTGTAHDSGGLPAFLARRAVELGKLLSGREDVRAGEPATGPGVRMRLPVVTRLPACPPLPRRRGLSSLYADLSLPSVADALTGTSRANLVWNPRASPYAERRHSSRGTAGQQGPAKSRGAVTPATTVAAQVR